MRVLLTNDDGYQSEGLRTLCRELSLYCEVYVAAPLKQQSGASHSMNLFREIPVQIVDIPGAKKAWAIDGTPVDSVKIGVEKFMQWKVDGVISGMNRGPNLGTDVFYSGTVGAATEAAILGIPAIAVSLSCAQDSPNYQEAAQLTWKVAQKIFRQREEDNHLLFNLNIPDLPHGEIKGICTARLGIRRYYNDLDQQPTSAEEISFILSGRCEERSQRPDDDVQLLRQGYATLTPLVLDRTNERFMAFCRKITEEVSFSKD